MVEKAPAVVEGVTDFDVDDTLGVTLFAAGRPVGWFAPGEARAVYYADEPETQAG